MSSDPFQFVSLADIQALDSPIIHFFTAEYLQEFAEKNCGGRLSNQELSDLQYAFMETWDCDYMHDAISKVRPWLRPGR
jgi:hypothetical protein